MSEFEKNDRDWSGTGAAGSGGATGVFGTVSEQANAASPFAEEPAPGPVTPVVPAATEHPRSPNVHEVIFHAPGSGTPGHTDSLKRILESSPPPSKVPDHSAPAAAPSGAGFTQLLRALTPADLAAQAQANTAKEAPQAPPPFAPPAAPAPASTPASASPSFTQVFSAIEAPMPKSPVTPPPAPAETKPSPSFTQMFAAISEPVSGSPKPAPSTFPDPQATQAFMPPVQASPAAPPSGGITQMFNAPGSQSAAEDEAIPAAAAHQNPTAPGTGGFTQMFQALDPKVAQKPSPAAEETQPVRAAVEPAPVTAPVPSAPSPTGGFTQMFQALDPAPKAAPPAAPSANPKPAPAPGPAPGGITQLLKAFDGGAAASVPPPSPKAPEAKMETFEPRAELVAPQGAPAQDPGSFTQIFQASPSVPKVPASPSAPPSSAAAAHGSPATLASGGSFTQLFSTLDKGYSPSSAANQMPEDVDPFARNASPVAKSAPLPQPASSVSSPGNNPGSFTQIFSASSVQPKGPSSQADNFPPVAPAGYTPGSFAPEGTPPGFSTPQAPLGSGFGSSSSASFSSPSSSPAAGAGPSSGGLTQLLRTLDAPGAPLTATKAPEPANAFSGSGAAPSAYGAVTPPVSGAGSAPQSLTQQFSAMNAAPPAPATQPPTPFGAPGSASGGPSAGATTAFQIPPAVQGPPAPAPQSGPGEYTRIIQASQFRESAAQGGAHGSAPNAGAPAAGGGGGMRSPIQFTPGSVSMPQMGGGSIGGGSLGGGSMGGGSMGGMHMGGMSSPSMGMPGVGMPSMGMPSVGLPSAQIPSAQLKVPPMGGSPQAPAAPAAAPKSSMTLIIVIIALVLVVAILLAVLLLKK